MPALGGSLVLLLALPVFLVAGWPLEGWGLAAVLWVAVHAIDLFLARARSRADTLRGSGVQAFGLLFKLIAILVAALPVILFLRTVFFKQSKVMKEASAAFRRQVDYLMWTILFLVACALVYSIGTLIHSIWK